MVKTVGLGKLLISDGPKKAALIRMSHRVELLAERREVSRDDALSRAQDRRDILSAGDGVAEGNQELEVGRRVIAQQQGRREARVVGRGCQ